VTVTHGENHTRLVSVQPCDMPDPNDGFTVDTRFLDKINLRVNNVNDHGL